MRKTTRKNIKKAEKSGITVREGAENDLGSFYQQMLSTCKRQGVQPSPSSEEFVTHMWRIFNPRGHIKVLIAEYDGGKLVALLMIPFGYCVKTWKVGWSGEQNDRRPNFLLYSECIKWAKEHGYRFFDLYGLNAEAASAVIRGEPLPEMFKSTPAFFKLGFGGKPLVFPDAQIFIYNPLLRFIYRRLLPRQGIFRTVKVIYRRLIAGS